MFSFNSIDNQGQPTAEEWKFRYEAERDKVALVKSALAKLQKSCDEPVDLAKKGQLLNFSHGFDARISASAELNEKVKEIEKLRTYTVRLKDRNKDLEQMISEKIQKLQLDEFEEIERSAIQLSQQEELDENKENLPPPKVSQRTVIGKPNKENPPPPEASHKYCIIIIEEIEKTSLFIIKVIKIFTKIFLQIKLLKFLKKKKTKQQNEPTTPVRTSLPEPTTTSSARTPKPHGRILWAFGQVN